MALADYTSKIRGKLIIKAYQRWLKSNEKVVDVGCGNGVVSKQIAEDFDLKIYGCDTLKYLTNKIAFKLIKKEDSLPFKRNEFKSAMFNDVLHHIPYTIQEKLILDALRVSKQVLIFEVQPTLIGTISDYILNKIHNPFMRIPFTFRRPDQWKKIFVKNKLKYEVEPVETPLFYPFSHISFRVTK
ncbi:MAG TPA: class I SAM-dependent methyltransferase [Patescibacteria group bacterium]|nr:class I SAM-dependent methyltransferase [Patescibacteria group bacterium]